MSSMARETRECQVGGAGFCRRRAGLALGALVWWGGAAQAQVVRGRVLEADTRKPVPEARVMVRPVTDSSVLGALTAADGSFVVRLPRQGRYEIEVARLGYRPQREGPFEVSQGGVLDLEIILPVLPYTLDPVTVAAEVNSRMLQAVGFYDRKRADFGHFLTRDQIETRRASRPSDLLRAIPGVSIVPDPRAPGRVRIQMRGTHPAEGGPCAPRVFVDGLIAIRGDSRPPRLPGTASQGDIEDVFEGDPRAPEPSLDDIVSPEQIEAIEVYRSASQVPAQFGGAGPFTRCGVLVIWTRRGR